MITNNAVITPGRLPGWARPPIRKFWERNLWRLKNLRRTTWAFYNTGEQLFVEPTCSSAITYYISMWRRLVNPEGVPFEIKGLNNKCLWVFMEGFLQGDCHLTLGAFQLDFQIPPYHILYVSADEEGNVCDALLVNQPLPRKLLPEHVDTWTYKISFELNP